MLRILKKCNYTVVCVRDIWMMAEGGCIMTSWRITRGVKKNPNLILSLGSPLQVSGCQQVWKPLVAPTAGRQKRIVFWKDIFLTPCICYGPETGKLHIAFINIFQNINISKSANASTNIFQNIKKGYIAHYTIGF